MQKAGRRKVPLAHHWNITGTSVAPGRYITNTSLADRRRRRHIIATLAGAAQARGRVIGHGELRAGTRLAGDKAAMTRRWHGRAAAGAVRGAARRAVL